MTSSSLNLSDISDSLIPEFPQSLLAKAGDGIPLTETFPLRPLQFSSSEWEYLCGDDPDPQVILTTVTESSGKRNKVAFTIDGKRCGVHPTRGPCDLPLAKITTHRIDYDALLSLPLSPSEELVDALSWIRTDRLQKLVQSHSDLTVTQAKFNHHVSRHVYSDMAYLHDIGVLAQKPFAPWTIEIPIFKVPKSGATESRLIGDARGINGLIPKQGHMGLPDLPDLILKLLKRKVLYQLDAKSYFYAFGMGEDASEIFGVRWGNRRGLFHTSRWLVMPQGFSLAPRIAQFTSLHLAKNATLMNDNVTFLPWIDNFLAGTDTSDSMKELIDRFNSVCQACNLELKPPEQPPGTVMDALGLHFDVSSANIEDHFVELQTKFKQQMVEDASLIKSIMTPREYFEVFGGLMWANYAVAHLPLCRWPEALNTIRSMAIQIHESGQQDSWDRPVPVSRRALAELQDMSLTLRHARRTVRELEVREPSVDLWTDASSWAWGYLSTKGTLAGLHRPHAIRDIFVAELLAACDAWHTMAHKVPNLFVENTGAVGALLKGHSSSGKGNLILSRLHESLPTGAKAHVTSVPTDCQRADLLSRGILLAGSLCEHAHVSKQVGWIVR